MGMASRIRIFSFCFTSVHVELHNRTAWCCCLGESCCFWQSAPFVVTSVLSSFWQSAPLVLLKLTYLIFFRFSRGFCLRQPWSRKNRHATNAKMVLILILISFRELNMCLVNACWMLVMLCSIANSLRIFITFKSSLVLPGQGLMEIRRSLSLFPCLMQQIRTCYVFACLV